MAAFAEDGVEFLQINRSSDQQTITHSYALLLLRGMVLSSLRLRLVHPGRAIREERTLLLTLRLLQGVLVGRSAPIVLPHVVRV